MATKKRVPAKKTPKRAEAARRANTAANALGSGLAGRARDAIRARQRALSEI